jgi:hypothetical protein
MELTEQDFLNDELVSSGKTLDASAFAGDALPYIADGGDFTRPINRVPEDISLEDRAKLSVGNDAGRFKYLKERFSEVKKLPRSSDFVVKDRDGLWKRVDKDGTGGDPWEIAADIIDVLPNIGSIGAQIGIGLATGGASLPMQALAAGGTGATTKGIETVLGKIVGTYDDSDDNMLKEVALEGVLNLGGTFIAAGVKPAIGLLANGIKKTGATLKSANEVSKDAIASVFGNNLAGGAKTVHTTFEFPNEVGEAMKHIGKYAVPADAAKQIQMDAAESIVKNVKPALSNFYSEALEQDIYKNIPKGFKSGIPALKKEIEEGFFDSAGLTKLTDKGEKVFKSFKELVDEPLLGEGINPIINDEANYVTMKRLWDALQNTKNIPSREGIAGAKDLISQRRALTNTAYKIANEVREVNPEANRIAAQFAAQVKQITGKAFNLEKEVPVNFNYKSIVNPKTGLNTVTQNPGFMTRNPLEALEGTYSLLKNNVKMFENAANNMAAGKRPTGEVLERLVQDVNSRIGVKVSAKQELDSIVDILSRFGGNSGKEAASGVSKIKIYNAAKDYIPMFKPGMLTSMAGAGTAGAAVSGNLGTAGALATAGVLTSPRVTGILLKSSMQGVNFLKSLSPKARLEFLKNPNAVSNWASSILAQPGLKQSITNQMLQPTLQEISGRNK